MIIAVVDGMGGSIGTQIVLGLRQALPEETEIMALGTNAIATGKTTARCQAVARPK